MTEYFTVSKCCSVKFGEHGTWYTQIIMQTIIDRQSKRLNCTLGTLDRVCSVVVPHASHSRSLSVWYSFRTHSISVLYGLLSKVQFYPVHSCRTQNYKYLR